MKSAPHHPQKTSSSLKHNDYLRFSKLVQERFGLHFPEKRRADLERGVQQAYASSTCSNLDEFYRLLQDPSSSVVETDRLINALTVSESHFFRDAGQFDALYSHVLPDIIGRRRAVRTLRIWSAGCASGQEPYSIAILLRELLPDVDQWAITILGTDINAEGLDRARKATYGHWSFREERAKQWRKRYFKRQNGNYTLVPEVRRMVTFARLNLAQDNYPSQKTNTTLMDLVICRNVTIYFNAAVTAAIIERFYDALTNDGWLTVGHAEYSLHTYRRFQAHNFPGAVLYQRAQQPPAPPPEQGRPVTPARKDKIPSPTIATPGPKAPRSKPATAPLDSVPEATDPLKRAQELLDYGRSEQARDLLLEVVAQRPQYAAACALLGRAYANLGGWQEAERWCRQAIHRNKLMLEAYYTLALVLQHQGQLDQAIAAMKKVIYIDHHHVLGHFGLADLYQNNRQIPQALKSLDNARRLLEARPDDELIPDSGGITAGRLREAVVRQQQQWILEA
jgi:chemotaxis protein methyltransferase CheR